VRCTRLTVGGLEEVAVVGLGAEDGDAHTCKVP
jgi:hypothetical protein